MLYNIDEIGKSYKGESIVIFGNGPSVCKTDGEKRIHIYDSTDIKDPIWTVNGGWNYHPTSSLGFNMHDFKNLSYSENYKKVVDEKEYEDAMMLVRTSKIPIVTVKPYYKTCVEFPLQEVVDYTGIAYFGEAIDYMIALACMWGVKEITFYGCDYNGDDRKPQERCGTEYWCGFAHAKGVKINVSTESSLLKVPYSDIGMIPGFYGYFEEYFPYIHNKKEAA